MEVYIVIFLLFFAILAFGWFYWQRAKARDAANVTSAEAAAPVVDESPAPPAE